MVRRRTIGVSAFFTPTPSEPEVLKRFGFTNVHIVTEQATPDGNFPTVVSPNPEETAALIGKWKGPHEKVDTPKASTLSKRESTVCTIS